MSEPLFSINAGENQEINFDIYSMSGGTWQGVYINTQAYNVGDVVVPSTINGEAVHRDDVVGVLRGDPATANIAYKCILGTTGNPPPNVTYWQALSVILANTVEGAFLEMLDSNSNVLVTWLYKWGAPLNVGLLDGLLKFELLPTDTKTRPTGSYGLNLSVSILDESFVSSSAETYVLSFNAGSISITSVP